MVCGDTWASELGILSRSDPRLVTSSCCRRRVPKATNGGVSAWGTLMSAAGGAFVGLVYVAATAVATAVTALLRGAVTGNGVQWADVTPTGAWAAACPSPTAAPAWFIVMAGIAGGLLGSLIDSVLGAVCQRSWFELATGRASSRLPTVAADSGAGGDASAKSVKGRSPRILAGVEYSEALLDAARAAAAAAAGNSGTAPTPASARGGARRRRADGTGGSDDGPAPTSATNPAAASAEAAAAAAAVARAAPGDFVVICGWDVLSNEQVNFVTALLTAALAAGAGSSVLAWVANGAGHP
jgi:uncharacterized membrane protein